MKWIDMHCDTLSMLLEEKNAGLDRNSLCIDIARLKAAGSAAIFLGNPGSERSVSHGTGHMKRSLT